MFSVRTELIVVGVGYRWTPLLQDLVTLLLSCGHRGCYQYHHL